MSAAKDFVPQPPLGPKAGHEPGNAAENLESRTTGDYKDVALQQFAAQNEKRQKARPEKKTKQITYVLTLRQHERLLKAARDGRCSQREIIEFALTPFIGEP